jgi:filamentous hemagglutinin
MTIDAVQRVRNYASQIAAGGALTIGAQNYTGASEGSDAAVDNVAVASQLTGERETQAWVYPEIPAMYQDGRGWHQTVAELQGFMVEGITAAGPTLAVASITAGQGLSIQAGDVTNTSVSAGSGLGDIGGGNLGGPGTTGLGSAVGVSAGSAGSVGGAQAATVRGREGPGGTAGQVIGTPERPLPGLVPSDNGMFDLHADPNSPFLVTTAPRFAKGDGTGSNYLLDRLGVTTDLHKRLGDGYYEQRLVLEQILQLTGRRSLTGNGDGFEQYRVLMDHAADEAARLGFTLGAPLTSAQIGALNQDIVWLVEQEVNGQTVLVPVVYLSKATADRMKAEGALMAADTVDIQSSGKVRNDGTVDSTRGTWLSADTLINDGAIRSEGRVDLATRGDTINRGKLVGDTIAIDAGGDVVNTVRFDGVNTMGGVIQAGAGGAQISAARDVVNQGTITSAGHAVVSAGRDFVQNAATSNTVAGTVKAPAGSITSTGSTVVNAGRDAVLDQSSIEAGHHAVIDAGRDAKFIASDVKAEGSIAVTAGRNIVSEAVTDSITVIEQTSTREGKKRTKTTTTTTDEMVTGSTFQAGGDIAMVADNEITLTAATVRSDDGGIALAAGNNLTLNTAQEDHSVVTDSVSKKKNTLSKTTTTTHSEVNDSYAIGTTLSGERVDLSAGNDMLLQGALVAGDKGVTAVAGNNITIETGVNTHTESTRTDKKKSGAFGSGGGFTIGSQKTGSTLELKETTHTGTLIGSSEGRVDIVAGKDVTITGSDVLSNTGTLISGENVTIQHAENTLDVTQTQYAKSGGIKVSLKGGVADVATTVYDSAKRAGEVEDERLQGLYAAKAGQALFSDAAGNNGRDGVAQIKDLKNIDPQMQKVDGKNTGKMEGTGGMSLRVGIGSSSSQSTVDTHETTAHGSTIRSNGDVAIIAREGNLTVTGSRVEGENVGLAAKQDILLQSAKETTEQRERSKASSGEVGITVGTEAGIGVYVSASAARGKGDGASTSHAETVIQGNQSVSFVSGGNTTLEGAQMIGERVVGSVGGDLTIRSQQDTDTYKRKDQSAGIDAAAGTGGGQVSVNYAQSKIDSNYTSVREQSGIQAGKDGFQIDVKGHTQLDGGAIASTATPDKNYFSTGSLGYTDLKNQAEYKATSVSVSVSGGSSGGSGNGSFSQQSDKASSTTKAGIADGTLIVGDGTGTDITRGVTELQQDGLREIYDAQKVAEQIEMQQVAGEVGFTAVGDLSGAMKQRAEKELAAAKESNDPARIDAAQANLDSWSEGGTNKVILHGVVGAGVAALSGGSAVDGLLSAGATQKAMEKVLEALDQHQIDPGSPEGSALLQAASIAIGAALGGGDGAGIALSATNNNYLSHQQLEELGEALEACGADEACQKQVRSDARELSQRQDAELQAACSGNRGDAACVAHRAVAMEYATGRNEDLAAALGIGDDWTRSYGSNTAFLPPSYVNDSGLSPLPMHPVEWTAMALGEWGGSLQKSVDENGVWSLPTLSVVATGMAQAIASKVPGVNMAANTSGSWGKPGSKDSPAANETAKGSPLPTPEPTLASNGLVYKSNPKHTQGQPGNRPNAGVEPPNSMQLFENSIASSKTYGNKEVRFAVDEKGNIHRFEGTNGEFHWNGSTGDVNNPLTGKQVPNDVQKQFGVRLR